MPRISVAIQTHPSRQEMAVALAAAISGAELVTDPAPNGYPSPWRTYRTALERTPDYVTHRLILQDDAQPCRWFPQAARAAIEAQPDRLIVFFVGGRPFDHAQSIYRACQRERSWVELRNDRWCPAVALAWPVRLIDPCLEYVESRNWPETFRADDEIICRFLQEARERPLATVPSLVEHPDVAASLLPARRERGGEDAGRVAACFICDDCDARAIDWQLGPA